MFTRGLVVVLASLAWILCVSAEARTPPKGPPQGAPQSSEPHIPVRLEPAEIDFGVSKPSEEKPGTFTLINMGDSAITITKAKPSCKCTDLDDLTGKVIQPGERLTFKVNMAMPPTPGEKKAEVYIHFAGWEERLVRARMKGVVHMAVVASPAQLDARKINAGTIKVASSDEKPFRILSAGGETPRFVGFDPAKDQPRSSYELQWDLSGWSCEGMKSWWVLETDHPECPVLPCEIWHECVSSKMDPDRMKRGWFIKDRIVNVGTVQPGKPVAGEAETAAMRAEMSVRPVTSIESQTPGVSVRLVSFQSDAPESGHVKFEITPPADHQGLLYAVLLLKSDSGSMRMTVIGWSPRASPPATPAPAAPSAKP
jgi:hypothetical protein